MVKSYKNCLANVFMSVRGDYPRALANPKAIRLINYPTLILFVMSIMMHGLGVGYFSAI